MQHGVLFPVVLQLHDVESLEEVTFTLEIGLQGGEQQALAEAARARQEEIRTPAVRKVVDHPRLVDVEVVAFAQLLKTLYAYG